MVRAHLAGNEDRIVLHHLLHERRTTAALLGDGYCVSTVGMDEDRVRQYIRR